MIVQDIGLAQHAVVIEGDDVTSARTVVLNTPEANRFTGVPYLSNDLQRTMLQVGLQDVPSSPTYCGQQLNALSESIKSLPPQYQAAAMPFLVSLVAGLSSAPSWTPCATPRRRSRPSRSSSVSRRPWPIR